MPISSWRGSLLVCLAILYGSSGPAIGGPTRYNNAATAADGWRSKHERQILDEYLEFVAIPNESRDPDGIRKNYEHLLEMMRARRLAPRLLRLDSGSPAVYGERLVAGAKHTYVFYAHYDGQPVNAKEWATPPFQPTLRAGRLDTGAGVIAYPPPDNRFDPDWRIYARAASDDKAQVYALLAALDALDAKGLHPTANLKFFFDGEEENGSPSMNGILKANKELLSGTLWLICDGPEHASRRQTVVFGVRGIQAFEITVYGPARALHDGHYGNWAPNPAMMLSQLLASMKDGDGHVLIDHFYDGIVPLGPTEKQALAALPETDAAQMRDLQITRTEGGDHKLAELITQPALNVRGLSSGRVGAEANNAIPVSATASLDIRLVTGTPHALEVERVIDHIRRQGYFVTDGIPTPAMRQEHQRIATVAVDPDGYDAVRMPMDLPLAQQVLKTLSEVRQPIAALPTMGGSVMLTGVQDILGAPVISIPIVNFDNSQHAKDENLRLGNLWTGIATHAALFMMD
jgi:acetylornithine deacetylase/succinyl-diaminopimelate desuccinylase-like protein